jgi:hypothetical protein
LTVLLPSFRDTGGCGKFLDGTEKLDLWIMRIHAVVVERIVKAIRLWGKQKNVCGWPGAPYPRTALPDFREMQRAMHNRDFTRCNTPEGSKVAHVPYNG